VLPTVVSAQETKNTNYVGVGFGRFSFSDENAETATKYKVGGLFYFAGIAISF